VVAGWKEAPFHGSSLTTPQASGLTGSERESY